MNRLLFRPLLKPLLGKEGTVLGLFLLSGLLHELAISFPAGGGWGGPLCYFALHGVLMRVEKRWGELGCAGGSPLDLVLAAGAFTVALSHGFSRRAGAAFAALAGQLPGHGQCWRLLRGTAHPGRLGPFPGVDRQRSGSHSAGMERAAGPATSAS